VVYGAVNSLMVPEVNIFSIMPIEVFSDDRLTKTDLRVMGVAMSFRDSGSNLYYPGPEKIAERAGLAAHQVVISVDRLIVFGYLDGIK
jgi:propanediol utilization protein